MRSPPVDATVRAELAGRLDTSYAVGAGAGSGKTTVLVDRVLSQVDGGTPLERIVAITFTDKAASELRERVRQRLSFPDPALEPEAVARRRAAGASVDVAQLTTIHGFCRWILTQHPLEAGVTPGFRVMDRLEADLLLEEAIREETARIRGTEDLFLEDLLLWGGDLGALGPLVRAVGRYPDLKATVPEAASETLDAFVTDLLTHASTIVARGAATPAGDTLLRQAAMVVGAGSVLTDGDLREVHRQRVLRGVEMKRNAGNRENWKAIGPEAFKELKEGWKALADRRARILAGFEDHLLGWLVERAEGIRERYARMKADAGALDFDDLLLITHDMLTEKPAVAARVASAFDALLVDEFQDTDPLQARIVEMLARPQAELKAGRTTGPPGPGRLFLVGDANQGIYRFRRADIEVFRQIRSALLKEGEEAVLQTNFRSTPALVRVTNQIFPGLLSPAPCAALDAYRQDGPAGPAVTLLEIDRLLPDEEEKPAIGDVRRAEAEALAWWVRERQAAGWQITDPVSGERRGLKWGDVNVLLRTQTGVEVYEDALERCGIPYRVSGGRAFFARLEIQQTLTVLRAVADPGDEAAIVGALRTPYFGVSDEDLVRWAAAGHPFGYLQDLGEGEDPPRAAMRLLSELHEAAACLSSSALIRLLFSETRALPLHLLKPDGRRRLANLLKLLDLAAAYDEAASGVPGLSSAGGGRLEALVEHLEKQLQAAEEEESPLLEDGDAVTLMTIHSAKGLEFPVVALLDREYKPSLRDMAIPDRSRDRSAVRTEGLKPSDWDDHKTRETIAQEEEARRLLYVAFTRARDHVVVPTSGRHAPPERAFLAPLEAALRECCGERGEVGEDAAGTVGVAGAEGMMGTQGDVALERAERPGMRETTPHGLRISDSKPAPGEIEKARSRRAAEMKEWSDTITRAARPLHASASRIKSARDYPCVSAVDRARALLRGTRVHEALDRVARLGEEIDRATSAIMCATDPPGLTEEVEELVGRGRRLLAGALGDGWEVIASEWPVVLGSEEALERLAAGRGLRAVSGTADLVLCDAEGNLRVVDYKTDDADAQTLVERHAVQVQAYAQALEAATGLSVSAEIWGLRDGKVIPAPPSTAD